MAAQTETVLTVDRPGPPPAPLAFLAALRELFARQAAAVLSEAGPRAVRTGLDLDLEEWEREMVARLRPLYLRYYQAGLVAGARQMAAVPSFPTPQKKRYLAAVRKAVSARFDLYEPRVMDAVDAAVLRFCRETNATAAGELNTTLAELRRQLKQGLSQGDAREALVARVRTVFTDPSRALRIAVTESARAVNGGQVLAWKGSGRVGRKRWLASSDACEKCLNLDGEEVDLDAPFVTLPGGGPYAIVYHPPLHPHCLLPGTPIIAPGARSAMRATYRGTCFRMTFSNGDEFACTENHTLLTPQGFLAAKFLREGDDVLGRVLGEGPFGTAPDDDGYPTPIEQIFDSLAVSFSGTTESVPAAPEYLHGDAVRCQGQIDVVRADSLLRDDTFDAPAFEHGPQSFFQDPDVPVGLLPALGGVAELLERLAAAADGGVGRFRDAKALRLAHALGRVAEPLNEPGFFDVAGFNPVLEKSAANHPSVHAKGLGDFVLRLPGGVAMQNLRLIKIESFHYEGPVYDVETSSGLYIIRNCVISSNCFCVCNPVLARPAVAVPARPAQAPPTAAPAVRPAVVLGPGRPAGPKATQPWDRDRNKVAAAGLFPRLRADGEAKAAAKEVTARLAAVKAETARLEGERKGRLEKLDRLVFRGKEAVTPEERAALRAETDAALAETKAAADRLRALYASAQKGYRDVLAGRLAAPDPVPVRPAFAAVNALAGTRAEQSVNEATDFLGKVLGRTAADGPAVSIGFRRVALSDPQRAYHEAGTVYLLPHSPVHEVLHEVGHALEYLYPKAAEAARAFWERRCGAGTATSLAQKFGPAYDPREVGYDDDFGKVYGRDSVESYYAGKRYPAGETEVLSMGLQALVERPADLAKDPEWWALVVGVLRGDYR